MSSYPETIFSIARSSAVRILALLPDKHNIPGWMRDLSERQFLVLLGALLEGDGHVRARESVLYGNEEFLGQIQMLAVTNGIPARLRRDNRGHFVLSLPTTRRGYINDFASRVRVVAYEGRIWCGTVANGTLVTRRNGIPLVSGNTTLKPRVATAAAHSYEWLLYSMLADPVSGPFKEEIKSGRIKFLVASGYHQYVDLSGFMVRFHHGDGFRYLGGVGGLAIPLRKAVDSWNTSLFADLDCFGHYHQFIDLGFALGNGSLIGYTAYALSVKARLEPPQQAFAMIDLERKVKTGVFPVFVQ